MLNVSTSLWSEVINGKSIIELLKREGAMVYTTAVVAGRLMLLDSNILRHMQAVPWLSILCDKVMMY